MYTTLKYLLFWLCENKHDDIKKKNYYLENNKQLIIYSEGSYEVAKV